MISRSQIKYINSLKSGKYREKHRSFIAEGPKLLDEILKSKLEVELVAGYAEWLKGNQKQLKGIEQHELSPAELSRVSALKTPNQVVAVVKIPDFAIEPEDLNNNLVLALHDIRDPGNMGTIIRSADWFGVRQIICSNECVDIYNPKVVQATMGSIARVKVHYCDLVEFFLAHSDLYVFGASMDGGSIYGEELPDRGVILIGSESHGIPENLNVFINKTISIPAGAASAESLNAGVAASIILAEFRRQNPAGKQK